MGHELTRRSNDSFKEEIYIAPQNAEANSEAQFHLYIGKTRDQHLKACCRGISSC